MRSIIAIALVAPVLVSAAAPARAQPPSFVMAACSGETTRIADLTLPHAVLADGKALPAGRYELRLTTQHPSAVPGATSEASCWVQFFKNGVLAGRELATVLGAGDVGAVAKGPQPGRNEARVDLLKGGDYYRIWINHEGTHYIINVPPGS
jgi:hypothetical protein